MRSEPRILILTLYSGENELGMAISALQEQTYTNWQHRIFKYLPNEEAHYAVYNCIMKSAKDYDLFIKLDADMVLNRSTALREIVEIFNSTENLDHAVLRVYDWATAKKRYGALHVFSNRVVWPTSNETLFVDHPPRRPGTKRVFESSPAPLVDHMPNPSVNQAYFFGYHRALKIVQRGRLRKRSGQADFQWELLKDVWEQYQSSRDPRRAAILWGAEDVFQSNARLLQDKSLHAYNGPIAKREFMAPQAQYVGLYKRWGEKSVRSRVRKFRFVTIAILLDVPFRYATGVKKKLEHWFFKVFRE